MNLMKQSNHLFKLILLSLVFVVVGCSTQSQVVNQTQPEPMDSNQAKIAHYTHQLANQLIASSRDIHAGQRVAVTSPVFLASGMQESNLVGLQLQQELAAELHALALNVVDFKLTDGIRVTPGGDFALSTNYLELRELQQADYILVGTLVEREETLLVSLRMLEFNSQIVKATAQIEIPHFVIEDLMYRNNFQLQ